MPANLRPHSNLLLATNEQPVLYLAFELGWDSWKLAFATGPGPAPRQREMPARDVSRLLLEIAEAKRRSFSFRTTDIAVEKAALGNEAGLYGAAYLPWSE